jgi:glycerol transport system substrate-binding protein
MKMRYTAIALAAALAAGQFAHAGEAEAKKWVDSEFQPSTLSKDKQLAEMKWFMDAAKKLQAKGVKEISVVSETLTTHEYESKTLAKAFEEITGIKVKHDIIQEGDVVEKLQTSMQSGKSIYDGWISDSDLIGTHYRYGKIMSLTEYMKGTGKEYTSPSLDLKDFIGTSFTTAPDGQLYQLPTQQFANLYWFRADLFARKDLQEKFKAKYGYELGVPQNWSAYEDIAAFFSEDVKTIDGKPIYGHTWITAKKTPRWAGVSPMPGCRWQALPMWVFPTACQWMNGASRWVLISARQWGHPFRAVALPIRQPPSTR